MVIKFYGETNLNKLSKLIKEVVTDIQQRAGIEEAKFSLKDAEIGVMFDVKGEKMMLSSEIDGVVEPFRVCVQLDEKGDIYKKKDNEEESFLDDYQRAVAKGLESPTTDSIKTVFNDEDLIQEHEEAGGDLVAKYYINTATGEKVIRYYRNDILVGETGYKQKEAN